MGLTATGLEAVEQELVVIAKKIIQPQKYKI